MVLLERHLFALATLVAWCGGCAAKGEPYLEPSTSACAPLDASAPAELEYVARVETGEGLVVIRPRDDWTYDDFRLFFGSDALLVERRVESVARAADGGSTWIRFDFHGETAEVSFPVGEDASLATGSGTYDVEELPDEAIDAFSFECLD